jgi:hypothetical protein
VPQRSTERDPHFSVTSAWEPSIRPAARKTIPFQLCGDRSSTAIGADIRARQGPLMITICSKFTATRKTTRAT